MTDETDDLLNEDPAFEDDTDRTGFTSQTTDPSDTSANGVPETPVPSPSSDPTDGEIGHLLASEEIMIGREDDNVTAFITTDERETVRVGEYVQIPYPDNNDVLFAATDRLRYEPYTDLDDKSDTHNHISRHREFDESEFVLLAVLDPIAILSPDPSTDELDRGIVNRIPKPNTPVRLSREDEYLRTGLGIPDDGVFCGYLSVGGTEMEIDGRPFPYYLSNPGVNPATGEPESGEPAVFRHLLVAGSTGKGKTHFTKNLLRQFIDGKRYPIEHHGSGETVHSRLSVVVIDPENEYWEMGVDPDIDEKTKRRLRRHGVKVGSVDDLEVFVPAVENVSPPGTGAHQSFGIPFELVESRPQLLMPYQPRETIRSALELALDSYFDDIAEHETATYEGFKRYVTNDQTLQDDAQIANQTWSAMIRRINDTTFETVFDHGISSLPDLANDMFREGQVTVIPTSHLRGTNERLVVLSILSYIIENKIDDHHIVDPIKNTPMLVAVDEAHNYFSEPDSLREQYIVRRAREAVKQGRKDKLGLMMITQNPEDIDDDVLKQINTNVFLGLREEIVEKVPSVPREFKRDIPKFGKGQAVVKAPDVEAVEVMGLPVCVTKHGN